MQQESIIRSIRKNQGFTLIELLIAIIIIGILVGLGVVGFAGMIKKTRENSVKNTVFDVASEVKSYESKHGSYPASLEEAGIKAKDKDVTVYQFGSCITGVHSKDSNASSSINADSGEEGGDCGAIQEITKTQCNALPTYTTTNEYAVHSATDSRGGTTQTYRIGKLADGNCWMLDNLKLGSTTGTITLTNADTNLINNSSFILPQLYSDTSTSYSNTDVPYAFGPIPGDSGNGVTNYGYLYNWPTATAGETRMTVPPGSGKAPGSICPANWRLPTGGSDGELAWLNVKMNDPSASSTTENYDIPYYQNWQYTGPFKGVFSGGWYGSTGFSYQSSNGSLWSSSVHPGTASFAKSAGLKSDTVGVAYDATRSNGLAVRCLLNQ